MLHLKTAVGERLEIPAGCIIAVMKPCDGINPCAVIYDVGVGVQVDQLADQYGFVKKSAIDGMAIVNPIEVRIVEQITIGEGAETVTSFGEGRMLFARSKILGRREVLLDPNGINARLFLDLMGRPMAVNIADTLDELDGAEPRPAAREIIPMPEEG